MTKTSTSTSSRRRIIPVNEHLNLDRSKIVGWNVFVDRSTESGKGICVYMDYVDPENGGPSPIISSYDGWTKDFEALMRQEVINE